MKILKYTLLVLLLLIVLALAALWFYLEPLVKATVHKFGTQIVGTEVSLDGFRINPLSGLAEVKGLSIANPEGYSASHLLNLGAIKVKVDPKSLLSDTIVVENISISKPEITYEMPNFSTSNVMQIQNNVAKNTASEDQKTASTASDEAVLPEDSAVGVVIKKVFVEDGALTAITPLQKHKTALTLNLPAVEISDVGGAGQKVSLRESMTTILNKILFNATSVVTKALGSAKDMAQKAAAATLDNAQNAVDGAAGEGKGLLDTLKFW